MADTCSRCDNPPRPSHNYCGPCQRAYQNARYHAGYKKKHRVHGLWHRYGITPEDYDRMLQEQGGGCAICGTRESGQGRKYFDIDHCHDTGKVRGLLCVRCNLGIGNLQHDVKVLTNAIHYLEK